MGMVIRSNTVYHARSMTDQTIRVGFVGAAPTSQHTFEAQAQPGVELMGVATDEGIGEKIAAEFGIKRVYGDWRELVRAVDIEAVCIGTWPKHPLRDHAGRAGERQAVLCEARHGRRRRGGTAHARRLTPGAAPDRPAGAAPNTLEVRLDPAVAAGEGYVVSARVEIQANQARSSTRASRCTGARTPR